VNATRNRLLLIEDDRHVRQVMRDIITTFGYEVDVAEDGATGLVKFQQGGFRVVITDLVMPGISGLQVAAAIRQIDPTFPIILLTGSANATAVLAARELGLTILHKPVMIPAFRTALEAVCPPREAGEGRGAAG
jgi:DNA-binding response OmpR family regulator